MGTPAVRKLKLKLGKEAYLGPSCLRVLVFEIFLDLSFLGAMLSPRFGDLPCGHTYICI